MNRRRKMTAMVERAMNATFHGRTMFDVLNEATDYGWELMEVAITAALAPDDKWPEPMFKDDKVSRGFQDAFYEIAKLLGIQGPRAESPKKVYEKQVKPRIAELVAANSFADDQWMGEVECCDAKGVWLVMTDDCHLNPGQKVTLRATSGNAVLHTPGPWLADDKPHCWWSGKLPSVRVGYMSTPLLLSPIAMCITDRVGKQQAIANARLIAAAPEMYEALCKLIEYSELSNDHQYGTLSASMVREIANAAIAPLGAMDEVGGGS